MVAYKYAYFMIYVSSVTGSIDDGTTEDRGQHFFLFAFTQDLEEIVLILILVASSIGPGTKNIAFGNQRCLIMPRSAGEMSRECSQRYAPWIGPYQRRLRV